MHTEKDNRHTDHNPSNMIIGADLRGSRLKFWKYWGKKTRLLLLIVVLTLLAVAITLLIVGYLNKRQDAAEKEAKLQNTAVQIINSQDKFSNESSKQFIKDTVANPTYIPGQKVDLTAVENYNNAYALAISFFKINDLNNAVSAYAVAESKLKTSNSMDDYYFYRSYAFTAAYNGQKQLAIDKLAKAKEAFLKTDLAKNDQMLKSRTINELDVMLITINRELK